MSDRPELDDYWTECQPEQSGLGYALTISDVLALPETARGRPDVIVNGDGVDERVRWVHIADSPRVPSLLLGGELLLTTGTGWPTDRPGLDGFVNDLVQAGAVGVILELGTQWRVEPEHLVQACQQHGLPLVVLRAEVRFVSISEAVYRRALDRQRSALEAAHRVDEIFSELIRNGAPADEIVAESGRLLDLPVVLEDVNHRVICLSDGRAPSSQELTTWRGQPPDQWLQASVMGQGTLWGRVMCPVQGGHDSSYSNLVLRRAALALAVGRMADTSAAAWVDLSQRLTIARLMGRSFPTTKAMSAQLIASGFEVDRRTLLGASVEPGVSRSGPTDNLAERIRASLSSALPDWQHIVAKAPDGAGLLIGLSAPRGQAIDSAHHALEHAVTKLSPGAYATMGAPTDDLSGLITSLHQAARLRVAVKHAQATAAPTEPKTRMTVHRAADYRLTLLLQHLHVDVDVQAFAEDLVAPILAHDRTSATPLLPTLRAVIRHPTSRSAAAAACHLSRTSFYQRLRRLEGITGANLDDGETLAALLVALLVHDSG